MVAPSVQRYRSIVISQAANEALGESCANCFRIAPMTAALAVQARDAPSPRCARWIRYKHFDRQPMIDDIAAVVPIMLAGLDVSYGIRGTGQQHVASRPFRRTPIKTPTPPC